MGGPTTDTDLQRERGGRHGPSRGQGRHRCPTTIVNAPVEIVWTLLTRPEGWGDFYDVRIAAIEPPVPAVVGQTVFAESGPWLLHLKLKFRFTKIDAVNYKLGLDVRLPFGITVRED